MKKYTFRFYPNEHPAEISVMAETKWKAEQLVRMMIPEIYFDDGLIFQYEEEV